MANDKHVAVIGAGLVGCINACFLARRGFKIDLYEFRTDIRLEEKVGGRSINLALSHRGRSALKAIGIEEEVIRHGIPVYSRLIHNVDGSTKVIPYGKKDQHLMAMDRRLLNEILLTEVEKYPNVKVYFEHKLVDANVHSGEVIMQSTKENKDFTKQYDLVIGNDGAYSAVRKAIMRSSLFNYKQEYISHDYLEMVFPPDDNGKYTMALNHLHIWPRNQFMMMALPNLHGSFTGTIFMPRVNFEALKTDDDVLTFFKTQFPDSLPLLGEDAIVQWFRTHKASNLISIKCTPYHINDRCLIMGDAAHAMVPFFGQGMNCGFEDALVLDGLMEKYNCQLDLVLPEYTRIRAPDCHAICDLSMNNYIEMRASVNSKLFLLRKKVDNFLHLLFPNKWVPLYTMVSFTRTPYHMCIEDRQWQDKVISRILKSTTSLTVLILLALSYRRRTAVVSVLNRIQTPIESMLQRILRFRFQ